MALLISAPKARQMHIAGLFMATLSLSGCGGGSDSTSNSNSSRLPATAEVNNGFHLVSTTGYDESGAVVSMTTRDQDVALNRINLTTTRYDTDEFGETSMRQYFSTDFYNATGMISGSESTLSSGHGFTTYTLDNRDYIVSSSRTGSIPRNSQYEYDNAGKLIRVLRTFTLNPDFLYYEAHTETRTFSYDSRGFLSSLIVEYLFYDPDPNMDRKSFTTTQYTNNSDGQITKLITNSSFSDIVFTRDFRYDSDGNVVESIDTSNDGYYVRYEHVYEISIEPIFNAWLLRFKFFPPR